MSSLPQKSWWENQVGTDEDAIEWEGKQCVTWKEKSQEPALITISIVITTVNHAICIYIYN